MTDPLHTHPSGVVIPPDKGDANYEGCQETRREALGRRVREVWVAWASQQPDPKPHWLTGWDDLDAGQREVDMQIGGALWLDGFQEKVDALSLARACAEKRRVAPETPHAPTSAPGTPQRGSVDGGDGSVLARGVEAARALRFRTVSMTRLLRLMQGDESAIPTKRSH